jgi:hypothetical protein
MSVVRIASDFNDPGFDKEVSLEYFGTLRDLSRLRLRLKNGMALLIYDSGDGDQDMEIEGVAKYKSGHWSAELNPATFRRVPRQSAGTAFDFLCFHCGKDIYEWLCEHKLKADTMCPHCGGYIREALHTPDDDVA